jgi:ribosome-associated heat shock protein Hsp15|tara:strand:- start:24219 stop:24515 length:297 start_codon:yes stop_codon:yes gene_type:complete
VREGKIRLNGARLSKPSYQVAIGDVLTFATGDWIRLIEISAIGVRRGPAPEAQALYIDRSDAAPIREKVPYNPKYEGKGRPTGKWRRALHSFSNSGLD